MPASRQSTPCALPGCDRPAKLSGRVYWTEEDGTERTHYLGKFCSAVHRSDARKLFRAEQQTQERAQESDTRKDSITCREYGAIFLERYERTRKGSCQRAARSAINGFLEKFGDRTLRSINFDEAEQWAAGVTRNRGAMVRTMFSEAVHKSHLLDHNPFAGTVKETDGRSKQTPPTPEEFAKLVESCDALGDYADEFRALLITGAYTGMRPGEMFALEWSDINFTDKSIHVWRNVYNGCLQIGLKTSDEKTIYIPPPAYEMLKRKHNTRKDESWVFRTKTGKRLNDNRLTEYWNIVRERAGLDFDFYMATKHFCVHYLYTEMKLEPRLIAEQMGWKIGSVLKMLEIYGHGNVNARTQIQSAWEQREEDNSTVVTLQTAKTDNATDNASRLAS